MISPRKTMANARAYQIFNEDRSSKTRLDLNENAWGCSPKVLEVIENATVEDIALYPEYGSFLTKFSQHYNVSVENVIISNGADDSIRCVFDCLVEQDDEVLLPVPNYGMFDIFGRIRGAKITEVLYNEDFTFPTNKILEFVSEKIKLIIIVNPANPLGTTIPANELITILKKAKESFILLDETYVHFVNKSYVELIRQFDNLIIVQTFSKAYGLTGLRLGILFSNEKNIHHLEKVNLPFAVNTIALKAGSAALEDQEFIQQVVKNVANETKFLQTELTKIGIETRACKTNFLLIKIGDQADQVYQALQDRGVLLRNLNKHPLLKGYLRITIGKRADNLKLLDTLRKVCSFFENVNKV
jgi:histidinol-phosphate aminotransferase